jgi:hypothetical protein
MMLRAFCGNLRSRRSHRDRTLEQGAGKDASGATFVTPLVALMTFISFPWDPGVICLLRYIHIYIAVDCGDNDVELWVARDPRHALH